MWLERAKEAHRKPEGDVFRIQKKGRECGGCRRELGGETTFCTLTEWTRVGERVGCRVIFLFFSFIPVFPSTEEEPTTLLLLGK